MVDFEKQNKLVESIEESVYEISFVFSKMSGATLVAQSDLEQSLNIEAVVSLDAGQFEAGLKKFEEVFGKIESSLSEGISSVSKAVSALGETDVWGKVANTANFTAMFANSGTAIKDFNTLLGKLKTNQSAVLSTALSLFVMMVAFPAATYVVVLLIEKLTGTTMSFGEAVGVLFGLILGWIAYTKILIAYQIALNTTIFANPIAMVLAACILALVVLIGYVYKWIQSIGGVGVAWQIVKNEFLTVVEEIILYFAKLISKILNGFDKAGVGIREFILDSKNNFGDMITDIIVGFADMVNDVIGGINLLNKAFSLLTGKPYEAVGYVTFGEEAEKQNEINKNNRNAEFKAYEDEKLGDIAERENRVLELEQKYANNQATREAKILAAQTEARESQNSGWEPNSTTTASPEIVNSGANYDSMTTAYNQTQMGTSNDRMVNVATNTEEAREYLATSSEDISIIKSKVEGLSANSGVVNEIKVELGGITNIVRSDADIDKITRVVVDYVSRGLYEGFNKTGTEVIV